MKARVVANQQGQVINAMIYPCGSVACQQPMTTFCESPSNDSCANQGDKLDPQLWCHGINQMVHFNQPRSFHQSIPLQLRMWDQYLSQITGQRWRTIINAPLNDHSYSKPSRWRKPPTMTRKPQPNRRTSVTRCNSTKQMHQISLNLTLDQSQARR